ncbi:Peptidase A1 [Macleaya cordata]|uniref:Peptidase A1 n=1 Tax=Macleaya cordata TaxID=56857 RepID=A0A200RBX1_MACCD|nr:Peptidase A1 [Macleaya cordata]
MVFGCGHTNYKAKGIIDTPPGVMGFNRGPLSFVSQLGMEEFSYCFLPESSHWWQKSETKMHFGLSALIVGGKTPLLNETRAHDVDNYYLNLEGISVGGERLPIPAGTFNVTQWGYGGFIIDSGTTFTQLVAKAFDMLVDAIVKKTSSSVKRKKYPGETELLELCYEGNDMSATPNLTLHFTGVDLELSKLSTWIAVDHRLWCLAMMGTYDQSILGNYQQQNINVGYDMRNNVISFKPMDCTKS